MVEVELDRSGVGHRTHRVFTSPRDDVVVDRVVALHQQVKRRSARRDCRRIHEVLDVQRCHAGRRRARAARVAHVATHAVAAGVAAPVASALLVRAVGDGIAVEDALPGEIVAGLPLLRTDVGRAHVATAVRPAFLALAVRHACRHAELGLVAGLLQVAPGRARAPTSVVVALLALAVPRATGAHVADIVVALGVILALGRAGRIHAVAVAVGAVHVPVAVVVDAVLAMVCLDRRTAEVEATGAIDARPRAVGDRRAGALRGLPRPIEFADGNVASQLTHVKTGVIPELAADLRVGVAPGAGVGAHSVDADVLRVHGGRVAERPVFVRVVRVLAGPWVADVLGAQVVRILVVRDRSSHDGHARIRIA